MKKVQTCYLVYQNSIIMWHTQQTSAGFYVITTWNNYLVNYTDFKVAPLIALAFRSDLLRDQQSFLQFTDALHMANLTYTPLLFKSCGSNLSYDMRS